QSVSPHIPFTSLFRSMRISLTTECLLDRRRFNAWRSQTEQAMRQATVRAMRTVGREMAEDVRRDMRRTFNVRKAAFLKSMRARRSEEHTSELQTRENL